MQNPEANQIKAIAAWSMLMAFRVKELLEQDVPAGAEVTTETVVLSARTAGLFDGQDTVNESTLMMVTLALRSISSIYPELLTEVGANRGKIFIRGKAHESLPA